MILPLLLAACGSKSDPEPDDGPPPLDLTEALGEGEVRAGEITDEAALFGGVAAEGRVGDFKLYNAKARFVIQGIRPSSYYIGYGGSLIDADAARAADQPGRDVLDDFAVMAGLGRLLDPEEIEVVSDGSEGPAAVRVTGRGAPMTLLTGLAESDALIPHAEVEIITTYTLEADSPLLRVTTEIRWEDDETPLQLGVFGMLSDDVATPYHPGRGLEDEGEDPPWLGVIGDRDEIAMGVFPADRPFAPGALQELLAAIGPVISGFLASETLDEGDTLTWDAYVGVGGSLSELTDAWYAVQGVETEEFAGTVTAGGAPVAGARVHLLDNEGAPVTLARTDSEGRFHADLPASEAYSAVATGRGEAQYTDLPPGAGWYAPYAAAPASAAALASLGGGAEPIPFAEGYGVSSAVPASATTALELTPPGILSVAVADGLPAVVRIEFAAGDPAVVDARLAPGRPGDAAATAWLRQGAVPLEPGRYRVVLHRGLRYEPYIEEIEVISGETVKLSGAPALSYDPAGVLVVDPHAHASPSGDGGIPMEERLLTHAANGVDVHVGTDHDHVADYRPLLAPLGLDGVLASVVADEFSPVVRGHINVYPLESAPDQPNGGALAWWEQVLTTPEWFAALRERVGGGIIQVNHPTDSGMVGFAGYNLSTGEIGDPDFWSADFDTIEVVNNGDYAEYFAYYLDMINRGLSPAPVGVSDSHGHRVVGEAVTFVHLGADDVSGYTDGALVAALKAQATVACHGPYIEATAGGAWAPGQTLAGPATVEVAVWAPSWVPVDSLTVYRDGQIAEVIPVTGAAPERLRATLALAPEADAAYVLVASSAATMTEVYPGSPSWSMAAAIKVDADGGGWQAPWPALLVP